MSRALFSLDANILVYCATTGDRRQGPALEIMQRASVGRCILTLQSLGEFFWAASRKRIASRTNAATLVRQWLTIFPPPARASVAAMEAALAASEAGHFSYWDAMLLATAGEAGCTAVISEDMAPGATLGPVRVARAFQDGAVSPDALALLG